MTAQELMDRVLNVTTPNVTSRTTTDKVKMVDLINECVMMLHSAYLIRQEQAVILVPDFRRTFKLDKSDPNVILGTLKKNIDISLSKDYKTKSELLRQLAEYKDNDTNFNIMNGGYDGSRVSELTDNNEEVLQILDIEDSKQRYYVINQKGAFLTDQTHQTLYLPMVKEGDIVYVHYKPKPNLVTEDNLNVRIDLLDTLDEVVVAYLRMRLLAGVEGDKNFYPNTYQTYEKVLLEALNNGALVQEDLSLGYKMKKGFL